MDDHALTLHNDGTSDGDIADASVFPRHFLYDSAGRLTQKTALIRYRDWLHRSEHQQSPWAGMRQAVPTAGIKAQAERSLADSILVSAHYEQHHMLAGAMLSSVYLQDDQVAVLLDALLEVLIDDEPAVELGPGAILDPSKRSPESKEHAKIRARTASRLGILSRDQIDNDALLDVASEQATALRDFLRRRQAAETRDESADSLDEPEAEGPSG